MADQVTVTTRDPEVVEILKWLQQWHSNHVQKLQMIVQAPADTELVLRGANGQQVLLVGDERKGFKAGCATALDLFGKFPLTVTKNVSRDTDSEEK
ncbi:hypothetical protein PseBG33_3512 [Pseudomonas synxantha BG33R]|uniref:hypothetical protein n=1 Tax=Pseudomonas TaxID=286 RepID=UPI00025FFF09|nr:MULTISPECIES: hypothetical protein [Pseudomonas]EIK72006.1 hypothetical protein PseBG33_3512 [Pseudomonas synxantha BG33R]KAA6195502.1 hypothetical protein F3K52_09830 [Pseudomonas lactis]MBJ2204668.1 hypothetical protein [Pseudomonas carnis]MQT99525.1 hypothetical protein [Pseudomonas sp. FSL R10-2245]QHA95814.1 hypothetical protein FXO12_03680 [Pseudomonas sp. J380]